ncbi:MAG: multicomponent Na+:H+ antiporter subunit [Bacillota bacterium]|jgi:multicomponent Na+:H+ antiporter subunit D|nr:multicomponent Na+:H+ antiporter subunit [Bacillota bacterium]MDK2926100.1 multicomponent Na+:H+ antiporter subunit [Bacillota bacterium]MDK2960077.1 multicomponent Na+:H+ antiporter subunit [Bacillota bacterium]
MRITLLPLVIIVAPVITGLLTLLVPWSEERKARFSLFVHAFLLAALLALFPAVHAGRSLAYKLAPLFPPYGLSLRVDALSFLVTLVVAFIWFLSSLYALEYMRHEHHIARYWAFSNFTLSGCLGVAFAGDLFSFFVFFEFMSLISYMLVIHTETPAAFRAGVKYLYLGIIGGLFLLYAVIATYDLAGTLAFDALRSFTFPDYGLYSFSIFLSYVVGFGIKAGMVPLHFWLPDAHPVAPSPASALLSGVLLKMGAYGMARVFLDVFGLSYLATSGWAEIVAVLAGISIIFGSLVAIVQDDLKRRLAYSSISQMGYILLGLSLLTPAALYGAVLHILNHALMKSGLFLAAGAVMYRTGRHKVSELDNIGRTMPRTMLAFTITALAMVGIPPLGGFISKWYLGLGAVVGGRPVFLFFLLLSSFLNALYYLPIVTRAFFNRAACPFAAFQVLPPEEAGPTSLGTELPPLPPRPLAPELPPAMLFPIVSLAAGTLFSGLYPMSPPFSLAADVVKAYFGG